MPKFTGNFVQHIGENLDVTQDVKLRILEDYTNWFGYQEFIVNPDNQDEMIPNPESRVQFMNRLIVFSIREPIRSQRMREARESIEVDEPEIE